MLLEIHPDNPQRRLVDQIADILENDGVIVYRTDTTYAFGCRVRSKKAMKRLYRIKRIKKNRPSTLVCSDIKQFQQYTRGIDNRVFRKIKSLMPGHYTFIFQASKEVPKVMLSPRSTIGVRIPDAPIARTLAESVGEPILSSSVPVKEETDIHDPYEIYEAYGKVVDCVADSGEIYIRRSSIIDFSRTPAEVIRAGDADLSWIE